MVLDEREEAFARHIVDGLKPTEAFRKMTGKNRPGDSVQAGRLIKKVKLRVQELRDATNGETVLSAKERRELLTKRARDSKISTRDLVAVLLAEAKLAGELEDVMKHTGEIHHKHTITEEERLTLIERRRLALMGQN